MAVISGATLTQWRQRARGQAIAAGIEPVEVDWFLLYCSQVDKLHLRLGTLDPLAEVALTLPWEELQTLWQRRLEQRVPLQYLLGRVPWRNFLLRVRAGVLIPRPETEQIIDIVQQQTASSPLLQSGIWVDLGTGSGAIALGLAEILPAASIYGIDCSPLALAIAQDNAQCYDPQGRVQWRQGHWWEPLAQHQGQIAGLLSNPPYIPQADLAYLPPEVRDHEPHLALDGGLDGLDCLRYLVASAPIYLSPGAIWLVEVMQGQAPLVEELLYRQGDYENIEIYKDWRGNQRFVLARRR
jgi:release factor glutamine methyltransferase